MLLLLYLRARPRRQAENPDKSRRILLVVALAHRERRKIRAVKRVIRFPAHNRNVSLVERQRHCACDIFLRALHKRIQRLAQWREPKPVVNQFRVFQRDVLLEMHHITFTAQGLKFTVRRNQQRSARSFVASSRLDSHETVLDDIDAPDSVSSANFVQQLDQRNRIEPHAIYPNRNTLLELNLNLLLAVRSFLRRFRNLPRAWEWGIGSVFQLSPLVTDVPQISVAAVDLFAAGSNGNAVRFGIIKAILSRF